MRYFKLCAVSIILAVMGTALQGIQPLFAQQYIDLTLDTAFDIALKNSYSIKQLQLGIKRRQLWLKARRAGLRSRVDLNLKSPEIKLISENEWNSTLRKDEIVRQNTTQWEVELGVRQPVILFGYPTNGYLSLNNRMYRYLQKDDGNKDVDYYNRFFIKFEQPFFNPNNLKNDIEMAELNLERSELDYLRDNGNLLRSIGYNYYNLIELSYKNMIFSHQVTNLEHISEILSHISRQDTTRTIEAFQVQVALTNAQEKLMENQSDFRLSKARMIQRLRLDSTDSLTVNPAINIIPITVDVDQALQYGYTLRPRLQLLFNSKQRDEISLNNSKGWDAFHVNFEITYGYEKQDGRYQTLWDEFDNSYSISLNAYIPILDWGRRKQWIKVREISLEKTELYIEENQNSIRSEILNVIENLTEYQERAVNMQKNRDIAREVTALSIIQFKEGTITFQDILQIINRELETENNFIDAYLGYRNSLLMLMVNTYYDYENNISLLERFSK